MPITCQTIIDRAKSASPLNSVLANDPVEMLEQIRSIQQELFTSIAGLTRDRFQTSATLTSTGGASGRIFDTSALVTLPVERILQVVLGDGREAQQVDVLDVDAELSPRYYVRGQSLIEVSNDWSAVAGAVSATLVYVYGMADIDPTAALTQVVSVPAQWIGLLYLPLAMWLFQKDPGRDESEYTRLGKMLESKQAAFLSYLQNYGGVESRRFLEPIPPQTGKK